MRRRIVGSIAFLFSMFFLTTSVDAADWPRWRGPNGDGISTETDWNPAALKDGPKIVWRVDVGMGYSNVVIKDNRLYTMGCSGREYTIFCFNAETGKEIWRNVISENMGEPQSTPAIDGEFLYALSKEGLVMCLKTKNGKLQWKKDIVQEYKARAPFYKFAGSPVVVGDLIILTANRCGIALNKKTGDMAWWSEKPPKEIYGPNCTGVEYATPVIYERDEKRYAVVTSYEGLHSVEADTGKMLWLYEWGDNYLKSIDQVTDPLIFDNKLFLIQYSIGYLGSSLFDIGGDAPKILWTNKIMNSNNGSPVMLNGFLYICQGGIDEISGSLRCLDVKTGKMAWEEKLNGRPISLMAAGGNLIILDDRGALFIAEATASGYREISRCLIPTQKFMDKWWTAPVLCSGKIYCRSNIGDLICIDVRM
jgi:outer membrane protein assembly factor BamB